MAQSVGGTCERLPLACLRPLASFPDELGMCGIAGIVNFRGNAIEPAEISRLTNLLAHRGPDGEGIWFNTDRDVALGHRRLAIIDPGPGGYQPMLSADARYVIVY